MADASVWATSLLGVVFRHIICGFSFPPSQLCCPLRFQISPQTHQWEGFLVFGNFSSFTTPSPGRVSFFSLFIFYILSYLLLKRTGCLFGRLVSSCQHSEVVLWNLLSVQMIFRWICGGESGLPILFLHHLPILIFATTCKESWGHYAKQNKPDRQRQILYAPCVCGILRKQYSYKKIPLVVPRERGRGVEELDEGGENVQTSS